VNKTLRARRIDFLLCHYFKNNSVVRSGKYHALVYLFYQTKRGEMFRIGKENKEPEEEKHQDVDRQALTANGE
jgi:hypothetical protein